MGNLKNNIDHYMKLKGIKMYSHLLVNIAHELGIKGQDAYQFANKEKSNFSKMLKDERPLKYEFIIPLEKIFGVSLARLLDEDAYKLPTEKDNVPFNKGFRYYAYLDDPKLYKEEFDLLLTKDGKSILTQTDEFGKTFLDYVVEYHSVNGIRYLHEEYGIKLKWYHNQFEFKKDSGMTWINFENCIEFARLVASMNDAALFNDIYDSYNMFFSNGHYASNDTIFCRSEYLEIILDNDALFHSIFERRPYEYVLAGSRVKREKQVNSIIYYLINPIINNCLRYALEHLDKYKHRAINVLKFGIKHNTEILNEVGADTYCICNELGGVISSGRTDWFSCDVDDIAVYVDIKVNDEEINALIEQLPKFKKNILGNGVTSMYHFQYISKSEIAPLKNQVIELIGLVQDEIRNYFTFQYEFIGSVKRNMVTCDVKSNIGFDFDVNIMVNDDDEEYSAKEIKQILMKAFNKYAYKYSYDFCEDSTRVFTIKVKDRKNSQILYSCDFAVVNNYGENQQEYIRFNKKSNSYYWAEQSDGFCLLRGKIEFCKDNSLWAEVRETYIEKKNCNTDKNKKSRSIFAETIHQVCQQNGYYR